MAKNTQETWYRRLWKDYGNILYCLPVILGILIFTLIPMVYSLIYAFCDYKFYYADNQFTNFGFQQFVKIFSEKFIQLFSGIEKAEVARLALTEG